MKNPSVKSTQRSINHLQQQYKKKNAKRNEIEEKKRKRKERNIGDPIKKARMKNISHWSTRSKNSSAFANIIESSNPSTRTPGYVIASGTYFTGLKTDVPESRPRTLAFGYNQRRRLRKRKE